jgi:energy-coupling factor transporter transmembrane protein EcfT
MPARASSTLAPSSKLALYLAGLVVLYMLRGAITAIATSAVFSMVALLGVAIAGRRIPARHWRGPLIFVAWVFIMRIALDVAGGASPGNPTVLLLAVKQTARVAFLIVGALALIAVTPARAIVDELETTRLPRSARLLVMMLVQYPRVLRDRYDQIVEAQVARGADRPRTILQRASHGVRILMPVMQSELNALGERAGLIHLRGLDADSAIPADARGRSAVDGVAVGLAIGVTVFALTVRVFWR